MSAKQFLRYWVNAFRNILFYSRYRRELILSLETRGLRDVRPFKMLDWHHGMSLFHGEYRGMEVFVKVCVNKGELLNESRAYDLLDQNEKVQPYLIKKMDFFETNLFEILVLEKEKGGVLTTEWLISNLDYLPSLIALFEEFLELKILHRDVKLDNFLVCQGQVKIFDFTFMITNDKVTGILSEIDLNKPENIFKLLDLGHYKPAALVWDDFYSLHAIFSTLVKNQKLTSADEILLDEIIEKCKQHIGANSYSILRRD